MVSGVPLLTLVAEAAPQREQSLRELFNAIRYVTRYGIPGVGIGVEPQQAQMSRRLGLGRKLAELGTLV